MYDRWRRATGAFPLVLGHRGARRDAPENTIAAFDLAREQGAVGSELDVRLDGSGRVIVLHDRRLQRVTNGKDHRDVEHVTAAELDAIDLGGGARIPTLSEVLAWARDTDQQLNIELKHDVSNAMKLVRLVVREISRLPPEDERVLLSSFAPHVVRMCARALPRVPSGWLVHAGQRVLKSAPLWRWLGAQAVHPETPLARRDPIRRWKAAGALVNVWTVNDPDIAAELASSGIDALITDVPAHLTPSAPPNPLRPT